MPAQRLLETVVGHKRCNIMLDNNFSPAYIHFMKQDRLQNEPPTNC